VAFTGPPQLFTERGFTVADILSDIELGDLGLPDIQRPFVWRPARFAISSIRCFKASLLGTYFFWATAERKGGGRGIGIGAKKKRPPSSSSTASSG